MASADMVALTQARLGLISFVLQVCILILPYCVRNLFSHTSLAALVLLLLSAAFVTGVQCGGHFCVWWRAALLGQVFALGLVLTDNANVFGWYLLFLSLFHFSEFLATAWTNPTNLSTDSFLLNHSPAYHVAAVASWAEFALELYFWPEMKRVLVVSGLGVALCVGGEVLRKLAMIHAGNSFNHIVQCTRREDHVLVTSGIFAFLRHPSYVGWFYWSVGTQLVLCNPICCVAYFAASWQFFAQRIYVEEYTLLEFFGQDYLDYKLKVPTGLPFIHGYDNVKVED